MMKHLGPHFIGIGPEKTGTSWIHRNLEAHPRVILPPLKELRYFWENANFPREKFWSRLNRKNSWHRKQYHDYFRNRFKHYLRNPMHCFSDRKRFAWDCRYLFSEHDDDWYLECFDRSEGFVCGEISPQYFFLSEDEVRHIHKLLPDTQIILSLRNPTDWIWSFARMKIKDNFIQSNDKALCTYLDAAVSFYKFSRALRYWKRYFPEEQLLVVFYDELSEAPWQLYSRVCDFLRIEPESAQIPQLSERVNEGSYLKLPDKFREKIENGWREDIEELSSMLPSLPRSWKNMKE
jgi:hypothetical protein